MEGARYHLSVIKTLLLVCSVDAAVVCDSECSLVCMEFRDILG